MKPTDTIQLLLEQKTKQLLDGLGVTDPLDPEQFSQLQEIISQRLITILLEQLPSDQRTQLMKDYEQTDIVKSEYFKDLSLTTVSAALEQTLTEVSQELRGV